MSVKAGSQSLLVKEMSNQANAAPKNEKSVEDTHVQVVLSFFRRKGATVTEEIDEADGDTTIDVEDEVVLLGGGDCLNGDSVVEEFVGGKVLHDEFFDKLDTEIGIRSRLDTVTDTRD